MRIDYDGTGEKDIVLNLPAAVIYEHEFHSDMFQDVIGRVVIRHDDDEDGTLLMDYRDVNWTAIMKALWAGLKAADDSTPSFPVWSRHLKPMNLYALNVAVITELRENFFRLDSEGEEGEE